MRRIISLVVVALVMAAMMLAMAAPAFADPNPDAGPRECVPPGTVIRDVAQEPGQSTPEAFPTGVPPGQQVVVECTPAG